MSVLVEPGHKTQYPLNHARILYRNVITSVTADSAQLNSPASAVLTKTTYERWKPTTSGDSITGTFTEQVINSIAIAAHSNLTPTIEVRFNGSWEEIKAFPPAGESLILDFANDEYRELQYAPDNEAILLLIKPRLCDGVRVTAEFSDNAPSIGVLMAGTVLEMARPVYGGHSPAMLSSTSTVRPNVSESGEWLGASLIRQGRTVGINWRNLPAKWVRQKWHPFSEALKTSPYVFAWNPLRASADTIYCSSSDVPQPSNSGTRDLMTVSLSARGYSDGTEPAVLPTAEIDLLSAVTFTRASPAWGYNANGDLVEYAANVPRNVHDPVTLDRIGLLIEEQRTNLLLWSEDFTNAEWVKEDVTVTSVADGYSITEGTATQRHGVNQQRPALTGTVAGFFVAKYAGRHLQIVSADHSVQSYVNFDLQNGTVAAESGDYTGDITPIGDGFYECSVVGVSASGATPYGYYGLLITDPVNDGAFQSYTGDGSSGVVFKRAQLEQGGFVTSYIKTEGATVTRLPDEPTRALGTEYNPNSNTWFIEYNYFGLNAGLLYLLDVSVGSGRFGLLDDRITIDDGTATFTDTWTVSSKNTNHKIAVSLDGVNTLVYRDGVQVGSVTTSQVFDFSGGDVAIGRRFNNVNHGNGRFLKITHDPRAYSAEELADLTT